MSVSGPEKATETSQWLGRWKMQGAAPADSALVEAVFLFISRLPAQSEKPARSLGSPSPGYQCYSLGLTPSNQPPKTAHLRTGTFQERELGTQSIARKEIVLDILRSG